MVDRAREVLLASVKSPSEAEIDRGVLQATMKERGQGFLKGRIRANKVPAPHSPLRGAAEGQS